MAEGLTEGSAVGRMVVGVLRGGGCVATGIGVGNGGTGVAATSGDGEGVTVLVRSFVGDGVLLAARVTVAGRFVVVARPVDADSLPGIEIDMTRNTGTSATTRTTPITRAKRRPPRGRDERSPRMSLPPPPLPVDELAGGLPDP